MPPAEPPSLRQRANSAVRQGTASAVPKTRKKKAVLAAEGNLRHAAPSTAAPRDATPQKRTAERASGAVLSFHVRSIRVSSFERLTVGA
jgi:hypothetical protein